VVEAGVVEQLRCIVHEQVEVLEGAQSDSNCICPAPPALFETTDDLSEPNAQKVGVVVDALLGGDDRPERALTAAGAALRALSLTLPFVDLRGAPMAVAAPNTDPPVVTLWLNQPTGAVCWPKLPRLGFPGAL
jgi:hypothetical protein